MPHEVAMMRALFDLRASLEAITDADLRRTLLQRASEPQRLIALRLDRLCSGVL